jgi:hypothetical protein
VDELEDDPDRQRRRLEARSMATDAQVESYGRAQGISREEIAEVRSRGPKTDDQGNYVQTQASEVKVPTRSRQTYQTPAKVGAQYEGEDEHNLPFRQAYTNRGVEVRTPMYEGEEQEKRRLEVSQVTDESGQTRTRLTRRDSPEGVDTTQATGGRFAGSHGGSEIFVMDKQGRMYGEDPKVSRRPDGTLIDPHHSSLAHGEDVMAAGEIRVEGGIVREVTDVSGHYKPTPAQMADAVNEMEAQGVPMIDPETQKRAKVRIESERFAGKGRSREMSFETFSQTGGNLRQVERKEGTVAEIDDISGLKAARGKLAEAVEAREEAQEEVDAAEAALRESQEGLARCGGVMQDGWQRAVRRDTDRAAKAQERLEQAEEKVAVAQAALEQLETPDPKALLAEAKRRAADERFRKEAARMAPLADLVEADAEPRRPGPGQVVIGEYTELRDPDAQDSDDDDSDDDDDDDFFDDDSDEEDDDSDEDDDDSDEDDDDSDEDEDEGSPQASRSRRGTPATITSYTVDSNSGERTYEHQSRGPRAERAPAGARADASGGSPPPGEDQDLTYTYTTPEGLKPQDAKE